MTNKSGWFRESKRHSLAARGIKTKSKHDFLRDERTHTTSHQQMQLRETGTEIKPILPLASISSRGDYITTFNEGYMIYPLSEYFSDDYISDIIDKYNVPNKDISISLEKINESYAIMYSDYMTADEGFLQIYVYSDIESARKSYFAAKEIIDNIDKYAKSLTEEESYDYNYFTAFRDRFEELSGYVPENQNDYIEYTSGLEKSGTKQKWY